MEFPECHKNTPVQKILNNVGDTCDHKFDGVDRCLTYLTDREHVSDPFARASQCHGVWHVFQKCVRTRNKNMMRELTKWESDYVSKLTEPSQQEHLEDIDRHVRYLEYATDKAVSDERKVSIERQKYFVMDRGIAVRRSIGIPLSAPELERETLIKRSHGKEMSYNGIRDAIKKHAHDPQKARMNSVMSSY